MDFIKDCKTAALDDLAAQFGLRTQEVINRVHGLEAMGRLTGVMDDRGKVLTTALLLLAARSCSYSLH